MPVLCFKPRNEHTDGVQLFHFAHQRHPPVETLSTSREANFMDSLLFLLIFTFDNKREKTIIPNQRSINPLKG